MNSIFKRTSCRTFLDKKVEKEKIDLLMKAACAAPSACNQQPWEFFVVTNDELKEKLAKCSPYGSPASNAPVVIVPVFRKNEMPAPMYAPIDLSIATENIWLEATELGLGGVWIGICPQAENMAKAHEVLKLDENHEAFALFACGYPAKEKEQEDRFNPELIHYID